MRIVTLTFVCVCAVATAAPLFAQESSIADSRGFVTVSGGFASALGQRTGDLLFEGGVSIAPHLKVVGDLGRFQNLQGDLQASLASTATSLATNQGLGVTTASSVPAWYGLGGLRYDVPLRPRVAPYVMGGIGVAHLNPQPQFLFASGALPDGSTPVIGSDVTSTITSAGLVTAPAASNGLLTSVGGGALLAVAPHLGVDVGYRFSRIAAGATATGSALNTNGMTFGLSYRF